MAAKRKVVLTEELIGSLEHDGRTQVSGRLLPNIYTGEHGLSLVIEGKSKRFQHRFTDVEGKRSTFRLGPWPVLSLKDATDICRDREAQIIREKMFRRLSMPAVLPRAAMVETKPVSFVTFGSLAHETLNRLKESGRWKTEKHADLWLRRMELYVFPVIGGKNVADITTADVVSCMEYPVDGKPLAHAQPATAKKVRQYINDVMQRAIMEGYRTDNPTMGIDNKQILSKQVAKHHAAIPPERAPQVFAAIGECGHPGADALQFVMLTGLRSAVVRELSWLEVDMEAATVNLSAERMKSDRPFSVPLSDAAMAILEANRGNDDVVVFGSNRNLAKPLTHHAMPAALVAAGINPEIGVVHGMRSTFRQWQQRIGVAHDLAELSLAHSVGNQTEAAYMDADRLEDRRPIIQQWANVLTGRMEVF